jgi:hypothetical protein
MALGHGQKRVGFVTFLSVKAVTDIRWTFVFVHFSPTFVDSWPCPCATPKATKAATGLGWRSHFEVMAPKQAAQSHASTLDCVVRICAIRRVIEPAHGFIHEIAMTTTSQMPPMMPR